MRQKILEINGEEVPALGFGTYKLTSRDGEKAIEYALSAGYRHVDTAEFYGNEDVVGNAIKNSGVSRKDIFITTKVWPSNFSKQSFIPSVQGSLKKLKVAYVDLLLLHWPSDENTTHIATELLYKCLSLQYTRLIGVSNFSLDQLIAAQKIAPVFCTQVEYSPYNNHKKLLYYIREENLMLTAYSPLARGEVLKEPLIKRLSEKYNKSASQVVLRWLLQQDNVAAIPKAGSEKHSIENMQIFDFEISAEDMQQIFALARNNS